MRNRLAGMWVKAMVRIRPIRRASTGANIIEAEVARPVQNRITPAVVTDSWKRRNSHSTSID